jgi:hypothetical protein
VIAHQPVHALHGIERGLDGPLQLIMLAARRRDVYERSKQRARAAHAIEHLSHIGSRSV